jgi:hypothetical protein
MGCVVRGHFPGRWALLVSAVSGGVLSLAVWVIACSSGSNPVGSDAGSGGSSGGDSAGDGTADDGGSDSASDGNEGGGLGFCISTGVACDAATVCCAGGTCTPDSDGGATCMGGAVECLSKGQPCSSSESCCNGQSNCGEGTTNTCP